MNLVSDRLAHRLPFFYGYVMATLAMVIQVATSPGQTFGVSAFTPALRESLMLSDSELSFAYMLGTLFAAVPLTMVGPLSDRLGLKRIVLVAISALACSCLLASRVTGFYSLIVVFFLLRFLGQGSLTLLSLNTVSMWFRGRVGRVTAAMSIGTAATFAWIPDGIQRTIVAYGWRTTYLLISAVLAIGILPLVFVLFRNRPEDIGQAVDGETGPTVDETAAEEARGVGGPNLAGPNLAGRVPANEVPAGRVSSGDHSLTMGQALRSRAFYIVGATNTIWAMAGTGIVFYLFTLCEDRGFDRQLPADLFKTFGLSMLTLQLIGGVLADYLPLNRLMGIGALLLTIGLVLIGFGKSIASHHGFAVAFGAGQGILVSVSAVLWIRYYGREHLGSIRGTTWCCTVAGSGCGPLLMGISRDQIGGFEPAIMVFLVIMSCLSILVWWATPPKPVLPGG